jgi:hypothetical protein
MPADKDGNFREDPEVEQIRVTERERLRALVELIWK